MKRTRMKSVSDRRRARQVDERAVRVALAHRDRGCRLEGAPEKVWGPCMGRLTPHHLRKAGQGGPYSLTNLVQLCAGHNDRVEELPRADMEAAGLVIPHGGSVLSAWVALQLAGIVDYWWEGSPSDREPPELVR